MYGIDSAPPPLRTPIDVQLLVDEVSTDKISSNLRLTEINLLNINFLFINHTSCT